MRQLLRLCIEPHRTGNSLARAQHTSRRRFRGLRGCGTIGRLRTRHRRQRGGFAFVYFNGAVDGMCCNMRPFTSSWPTNLRLNLPNPGASCAFAASLSVASLLAVLLLGVVFSARVGLSTRFIAKRPRHSATHVSPTFTSLRPQSGQSLNDAVLQQSGNGRHRSAR
jgi:hypothetical protein